MGMLVSDCSQSTRIEPFNDMNTMILPPYLNEVAPAAHHNVCDGDVVFGGIEVRHVDRTIVPGAVIPVLGAGSYINPI